MSNISEDLRAIFENPFYKEKSYVSDNLKKTTELENLSQQLKGRQQGTLYQLNEVCQC